MVLPDWTTPQIPKVEFVPAQPNAGESMARPVDRLAAAIVDVFVLLVPLFILLSAPLKRWLTASFILGSEPDFVSTLLLMICLGFVMVVSYQSLMHYYFGATFGKMLFNLRVKPAFSDERTGLGAFVLRSVVWVFEFLPLGLPFLGAFTNRQRRCLHDRVSDTCVVTEKGNGVAAPSPIERGIVRGFFAACVLFMIMIASVQVHSLLGKMKSEERALGSAFIHEAGECEVVSKNISADDEDRDHARLELAMSLYAAGLAERSCLESELEREMAMKTPVGAITYLAQAFVNADDAEVSNSYLDEVCASGTETVECAMSKIVGRWSDEDWGAVETLLTGAPRGSGYLEVWAVRHHMKQAQYGQALAFLDSLSDHHELAEFSQVQRVKALYNSYAEKEASVAFAQALPSLSPEEGEEIGAWMCAQELQRGCAGLETLACRGVPHGKDAGEIDFEHSSAALSRVMALECKQKDVDYLTFSETVRDEDWQTFFRANLKHQRDDNAAAFKLFADVVNSNSAPEILRSEALRRVSQFASRAQMGRMVDAWKTFESKETWIKSGNQLFSKLMERNDQVNALRVARDLMSAEAVSPAVMARLSSMGRGKTEQREPASQKEEVRTLLRSHEEEK